MKIGLARLRQTLRPYDLSIGGSAMSNQRFTPEFK
ncbi:hypothetical protein HDE77_000990, partial [Rhodanobacter sp. MP7CTX1]|nr:hypothetical protein [Rhodanobacter sp. MP7CTX1]